MVDIGDFGVVENSLDLAQDLNRDRSKQSRSTDAAKRGPVTTDFQEWEDNPGELDFPGVDTPSTAPDVLPKDLTRRKNSSPSTTARASGDEPFETMAATTEDVRRTELSNTDVSLSPGEAFDGVGAAGLSTFEMQTDISAPEFSEQRGMREGAPPESALQEQATALSGVKLDNSDRGTIRELEMSGAAGVRDPEILSEMRFSDEPTAEQEETFTRVADSLLSGRDAIEDPNRTDTEFFESDTLDDVADLRDRVNRGGR